MDIRTRLLQLHLAQGLGHQGAERLWQFFRDQPLSNVADLATWSTLQIAKVAQLKPQHIQRFMTDFTSQRLTQAVNEARSEPFITIIDAAYPEQLRQSFSPPLVLWYQGDLRLLKTLQLAVVGARQASSLALTNIRQLLPPIGHSGITLTSGLAAGVDGWTHQLAINEQTPTIAVIGTGLGRSYPAVNRGLQQAISQWGLVISEYPKQTPPARHHFPARNRIIAGLSQAILVVEARQRSGSLITANLSLQNNREVLAIPGRLSDPLAQGTNELIAAGAKIVLNSRHIIEAFCLEI